MESYPGKRKMYHRGNFSPGKQFQAFLTTGQTTLHMKLKPKHHTLMGTVYMWMSLALYLNFNFILGSLLQNQFYGSLLPLFPILPH